MRNRYDLVDRTLEAVRGQEEDIGPAAGHSTSAGDLAEADRSAPDDIGPRIQAALTWAVGRNSLILQSVDGPTIERTDELSAFAGEPRSDGSALHEDELPPEPVRE